MIQTGVSYFSARTLRHVQADLRDIVDHSCTYVVHCLTETDLAYYYETMRDIVAATHDAGLEAWLDPWGVAGIFSGEAFTRFPLDHPEAWQVLSDGRRAPVACPNHAETRQFLRQWVEAAAEIGGDVLFWDEPHFYVGLWQPRPESGWACRCQHCQSLFRDRFRQEMPAEFTTEVRAFREASLLDLLAELCRFGHEKGLGNALCLIPTDLAAHGFPQVEERWRSAVQPRLGEDASDTALAALLHIGVGDWDRAAAIPDLDIFGCDPYWYIFGVEAEPFLRAYGGKAAEAARRHRRALQLWVQAFRVPAGREKELRVGLRLAQELGASHVAAWSYEGTASSDIRCARPEIVWRILGEEFRRLRQET